MRAYSQYNLLGKQLGIQAEYTGTDLFSRFIDWLDRNAHSVTMSIKIPNLIYLKTETLCEAINDKYKDYDVEMYADYLVGCIYRHFITKAYNNKNGLKHAYETLTKIQEDTPLIIRNHINHEIHTFHNPLTTNIYIENVHLTKKWVKKGELLLLELDELYGHEFTVEDVLQKIWIHFIQERKNSSEKKIIGEVIEILESLKN